MRSVSLVPHRRAPLLVTALLIGALLAAPSAGAYNVTTLTGFSFPINVAISPDGSTAYIPNHGGGGPYSVGVINLAAGTARPTAIDFGHRRPLDVAVAPNGARAYVTADDDVLVIDTATSAVIGSPILAALSGSPGPWGIAVTADGRRAYTANHGNNTVGVIDLQAGQATGTVSFGGTGVIDVAVHASSTDVLAIAQNNDTAWMVQTTAPTQGQMINASSHLMSAAQRVIFSPDGTRAYIASLGNGTVIVADVANRRTIAAWSTPDGTGPNGLALSPSGDRLYASLSDIGNAIAVFDTTSGERLEVFNHGGGGSADAAAIAPDGSRLVVANPGTDSVSIIQLTPLAPSGLSANASDTTATVSFTAAVANDTPITGYQYALNGGAWSATTPATTASPLTIAGLTPGIAYAIRVRAMDARGPGATSASVSVTTQSPAATSPRTPDAPETKPRTEATKPRVATGSDGSIMLRTTVTTPGAGKIIQTATGSARRAKAITHCTARVTVKKAGEHVVSCRLNTKTRAALRKVRLVLTVRTTFIATGATTGSTTTTTVVVPRRR